MTTPVSRMSTHSPPVAVDGMLSLAPAIATTSTPAGMVEQERLAGEALDGRERDLALEQAVRAPGGGDDEGDHRRPAVGDGEHDDGERGERRCASFCSRDACSWSTVTPRIIVPSGAMK